MSDVWEPVAYAIKKGRPEGFKFSIEINGKSELVKFKDNLYRCPSAEHGAAIEALMHRPQFTQNIQKVDVASGEALARAHIASQRNSAVQGGMTSEIAKSMENQVASEDVKAVTDELAKENLIVTETAETIENSEVKISDATKVGGSLNLNIGNKT